MLRRATSSLLTLALIGCCLNLGISPALAAPAASPAPSNNGEALEISPPVVNLTANPGQTISTLIRIRNISRGPLVVTGQVNDFVAGSEDGRPKLLLDTGEVSPYSLKGWVTSVPRLTLVSREVKAITIKMTVPADASPGGHYGVVRFTATPPELEGSGVSLSASLGSLVLVRVGGQVSEKLAVEEFSANRHGKKGTLFETGPLNFVERLKNSGNVHLQPSGQVHITDMFGRRIGDLNVNLPPRNVLPASIRKFDQTLDSQAIGKKFLFGRYTAKLDLGYGDSKQKVASSLVFWVIPYRLITLVLFLLVIGFFLFRSGIRRYNQFIVSKVTGTKPKPKARSKSKKK